MQIKAGVYSKVFEKEQNDKRGNFPKFRNQVSVSKLLYLKKDIKIVMGTVELKSSIHKIIDGIQSEQLLQTLYDFLKIKESDKSNSIWDSLSEEQKKEVFLAYEESEDETELIDKSTFFK